MNKKIITLVLTFIAAINLFSGVLKDPEMTQQMIDSLKDATVLFSTEKATVETETGDEIYSYGSAIDFFGSLRVE